jgi:hypothetical protein
MRALSSVVLFTTSVDSYTYYGEVVPVPQQDITLSHKHGVKTFHASMLYADKLYVSFPDLAGEG